MRRILYFVSGAALLLAPRLPWLRLGAQQDLDLRLASQLALFAGGLLMGAAFFRPLRRTR